MPGFPLVGLRSKTSLGNTGAIQRRQRLGGMLNYYYRTAA